MSTADLITYLLPLAFILLYVSNGRCQDPDYTKSSDISITSVPYMVSLQQGSVHYCCGSYIKPRWVLTTSHCIYPERLPFTAVKMGDANMKKADSERKVKKGIQHALMAKLRTHRRIINKVMGALNNIGLLKIDKPFPLGDSIQMINIASRSSFYGGRVAETAGWGRLCLKDNITDALRSMQIPIARNDRNFLTPRVAIGQCLGDSGSPVVLDSQIIGLVVCGFHCGELTGILPNGFIEIYHHISWIKNHTDSS